MQQYRISIWFFIGLSLLVNWMLICGAGIWELAHPAAETVVLFRLHAGIWWGAARGPWVSLYAAFCAQAADGGVNA